MQAKTLGITFHIRLNIDNQKNCAARKTNRNLVNEIFNFVITVSKSCCTMGHGTEAAEFIKR